MKKRLILFALIACSIVSGQAQIDTTFNLHEVVVTGSQVKVSRSHLPQTISVITRDEIESSSESALLPVISERVPGVFVTERGVTGFGVSTGAAGQINIRGIGSGTRVLTMFDGQPQWAGIFGHHLPDTYVASDVERVEVIRGPASLLYGSNAMGGVINIITRSQNREGFHGQARASAGSYGTQKYLINGGFKQDKLNLFASVNHDRTDGHRPNSRFWITNGYAKGSYAFNDSWKATGDITIAKYFSDNPGSVSSPMLDNWVDVLRGTFSASVENNYDRTSGAVKLYYNMGNHEINDGHTATQSPKDYLFRSKDHVAGVVAYQSIRLLPGNNFTIGLDYKNWGGRAWNQNFDKPDQQLVDKSINETAVYAMMQQSLFDKLSLSAGVRLENNQIYGSEWIPQAGLSYHPFQNTTFKASYSKGFRSPNIRELYMFMPANPDLKPERVNNYDVSILQSFLDNRLRFELTGFIANGSNLIQTAMIDGKPKNINSGSFDNKGVEFSMNWAILRNLALTANYSYLHMDNPILAAPKHQLFIAADYTIKKVTFNLHYQNIDQLYLRLGDNPVTESYYQLNAKVTYKPTSWISLYVKGENLTDQAYSIMDGFPMPGVTALGGVSVNF